MSEALRSSLQSLPRSPCYEQTDEAVNQWLKANVALDAVVVVRHTQAGFTHYVKAKVIRLGKGRFEVDTLGAGHLSTAGTSFFYSGKNCWEPKGQTRLVIPTDAVLAACTDSVPTSSPRHGQLLGLGPKLSY